MADPTMKENVVPRGNTGMKEERTGLFARTSRTPEKEIQSPRAKDEMFSLAFSPPKHANSNKRRVTFVNQEELCRSTSGLTLRERRQATPLRDADETLTNERRKMERLNALAESSQAAASECSSPAPWRLLPRRESLTPRDAESREIARHVAALRLQTLLHRRRARRARARTIQLEKEERDRRSGSSQASSIASAIVTVPSTNPATEECLAQMTSRLEEQAERLAQAESLLRETSSCLAEAEARAENDAKKVEVTVLRAELAEEKVVALELELESSRQERASALHLAETAEQRRKVEGAAMAKDAVERAERAEVALREATESYRRREASWEAQRRSLHDRVVELRGNVRAFVRVRPPLLVGAASEPSVDGKSVVSCRQQFIEVPETVAPGGPPRKPRNFKFAFDRVFPIEADQADVFAEVMPLVQSALDGHAVCVFAYGQTGSGKTYTTIGTPTSPGILGRALDALFRPGGPTLSLEILEIYLDKVYDLLGEDRQQPLAIFSDDQNKFVVKGQRSVPATNSQEAAEVLAKAQARRKVGATRANDTSSRSHCLITIRIGDGGGVFNLVDLAGSERLKVSAADQIRLKETQFINTSLAALGNCVAALKNGQQHVPYRDAKLTFLLQPYLGGSNKTLALVTVAAEKQHERETLCSLRFAQQVTKVVPTSKCHK